MKCEKCGRDLSESALFCPKCGEKVERVKDKEKKEEGQMIESKSEIHNRKISSKIKIFLISVMAVSVLMITTAFGLTISFRTYLSEYKNVKNEVNSLGTYEEEYKDELQQANFQLNKLQIWKFGKQKTKMKKLCKQIKESDHKFKKYWEAYNEVITEIETSHKYFLGNYEKKYRNQKKEFQEYLETYKEKECRHMASAFTKWKKIIPQYNKKAVDSFCKELDGLIDDNGYLDYEHYIFKKAKKTFKNEVKNGQYYDAWNIYQQAMKTSEKYNSTVFSSFNDFYQLDASEDNVIKLYFSDEGNEGVWNQEQFELYESNSGKKWNTAEILDIKQIQGDLSIDLVADISTSMDERLGQFEEMKTAVCNFINLTGDETYLGLSVISGMYRRESEFTKDKDDLLNCVEGLYPEGRTSLYQSLYSSVMYTASTGGAKCVVAFTDGRDEPYGVGYDYNYKDVIDVAQLYQIPVYIIGIGSEVESDILSEIAYDTGGDYYDIDSVDDLAEVYDEIYSSQKKVWEISYRSQLENTSEREVYMYCDDSENNQYVRTQFMVDPQNIINGYSTSEIVDESDLTSYYTNKKYLSSEEIEGLSIDDLQTVINIYSARNGYKFTKSDVLQQMKDLGIIEENGTKTDITGLLKKNKVLWANYEKLYNTRYELIYDKVVDVYNEYDGDISLSELQNEVNSLFGQENGRFNNVIKTAYDNFLKAE